MLLILPRSCKSTELGASYVEDPHRVEVVGDANQDPRALSPMLDHPFRSWGLHGHPIGQARVVCSGYSCSVQGAVIWVGSNPAVLAGSLVGFCSYCVCMRGG